MAGDITNIGGIVVIFMTLYYLYELLKYKNE